MAVAPQARQHRATGADRHPAAPLQLGEIPVVDPGERLGHHPGGAGADPVEVGERARVGPLGQFGVADGLGHCQRPLEGAHLGSGGQLAVQVVHRERECH